MAEAIELAKNISIKEAGKDEYWLQDQIYENPNCLGLGELEIVEKEKRQLSGGRLDILLKNSEDNIMYEIEVMLGETDESHIIRTIEYWDNESRKWPQKQHFAVLIAERISRRLFNIIHLLSNSIPIIAIQVSMIEVYGKYSLYFSKILDVYEEHDDEIPDNKKVTRDDWIKKSKWTVETADYLLDLYSNVFNDPILNYMDTYISITVSGNNYLWLLKRSQSKSLMGIRIKEELRDKMAELLDRNNLPYVQQRKLFNITIDKGIIENNKEAFLSIGEIIKEYFGVVK